MGICVYLTTWGSESSQHACPFSLVFALITLPIGCAHQPERIQVANVSPDSAAQQAIATCDANGDSLLEESELTQSPGLRAGFARINTDGDDKLTASEIATRICTVKGTRIALTTCHYQILLNKQPVSKAKVTLTPEPFQGESLKPATGETDGMGMVLLRSQGATAPGVAPGFYRLSISKPNAAGKEQIPAKYNQESTLGVEVAPDVNAGIITIHLDG